jgi:hypothetical protein
MVYGVVPPVIPKVIEPLAEPSLPITLVTLHFTIIGVTVKTLQLLTGK